jgi:hypothetical protein
VSSESTFDEVGVEPGCGLHGDVYLLFTGVERKSLRTKNTRDPYVVPTGCSTRLRASTVTSLHLYDILAFAKNPSTRLFYSSPLETTKKLRPQPGRGRPSVARRGFAGLCRTLTCG